ncbi:hypothetical protein Tco_0943333 [Tanacetum coccineum]
MVAAGGNILRKTPQEAYDLIKNMTQHHFQWDVEVYYDTTTGVSAHYSETTFALSAQIKVLGKQTAYTIQSVHHQPGPVAIPLPVVESLSPLPTPFGDSDSLLEETDTLLSHSDDSLPDYETFCFDIEEKSSGSTTSHSDHSLPDYEAFCFDVDHIEEKSSGSTTSHSDLSLLEYESFHFDLSIDQLPPADRSDFYHKEFADELAHIISPPEYDHFYFDLEDDPGELTRLCEENISDTSTKDLTINKLNDFPLFLSDCDSIFSEKFSEIDLLVLFPSENKDKVFDPRIFTINGVHFKRFPILILDDFLLLYSSNLPSVFSPRIKKFRASQASDSLINKRFSGGNPCGTRYCTRQYEELYTSVRGGHESEHDTCPKRVIQGCQGLWYSPPKVVVLEDRESLAVGENDELVTEKVLQLLKLDSSMVQIQDIRSEDFQEEVKWSYGINTASLLYDIYVNTGSINMDDTTAGHHC